MYEALKALSQILGREILPGRFHEHSKTINKVTWSSRCEGNDHRLPRYTFTPLFCCPDDLDKANRFLPTKLDPKHLVSHKLLPKQGSLRTSNICALMSLNKLTTKHRSLSIIDAIKSRNFQRKSANNEDFSCFTHKQIKLLIAVNNMVLQ